MPARGEGIQLLRWFLLDGNRHAVTGALLTLTFVSILVIGSLWTFEMHRLLTETQAVQTVLITFLSGIILLTSIVVSINSIVLSHDITDIETQSERIEEIVSFRREIGNLSDTDEAPTDPSSFLEAMANIIQEKAYELESVGEEENGEIAEEVREYVASIVGTAKQLELSLNRRQGGEFHALWQGIETDYGPMMNRMRRFTSTYDDRLSPEATEQFEELLQLFKTFATGREYFKTLYYNREVSSLSRTLLIVSLPTIIATAWATLIINADLLPEFWLLGLPPLLTFVALTFTVALIPFIVLTSYMIRLATVTRRTAAAGPFVLK